MRRKIHNKTSNTPLQPLPLAQCLAKTFADQQAGRKVTEHCQIVGEIARALLQQMPSGLRKDLFPPGSELIAAIHDVGKISPTFQEKIYRGTKGYIKNSKPELKTANPELEKNWDGHASVSQATAEELNIGKYIPEIVGQHHGYAPRLSNLANDAVFGGKAWQQQREILIEALKKWFNSEFPEVKNDEQARVLAGLTSVADWIGSGSLFDEPDKDWQPLIHTALNEAGFIQPKLQPNLSFQQIFPFEPNAIQQDLINNSNQAGVYVLEAPMGIGKTEAALYAAYQHMATGQATGIYFALPTQLTSDKIHTRMNAFLDVILAPDSPHRDALLIHGNAWLKQTELGKEGQPNGSWFQAGKRRILAPFAVGTIDQALMAVMNVKHGFVRSFGLAGKVVILDEVHSYDAYTGTILDELVRALRAWHCTVIILSATLTAQRRQKLTAQTAKSQHYPLISVAPNGAGLQEIAPAPPASHQLLIRCCQLQVQALDEALKRAEAGQQVLWIENTVANAQAVFKQLSAIDIDVEYGLLHSRFLKCDRAKNEKKWVDLYGKGKNKVRKQRGRILVGTQVLEQSLDIDADFLISRFCPTDMLLQRMGRLWRHQDNYRPPNTAYEAWLLTPEPDAAIADAKQQFGDSAKVYAPYVLCRSLQVWQALEKIELPTDIRPLIEATYQARKETGKMLEYQQTLEKKRETLQRLALVGLSKGGQNLPETASTRYSEQDSVQVLLIKACQPAQQGMEVTLLNGEKYLLPKNLKFYDKPRWRELAALLLKNCVQVVNYHAPEKLSVKELDWLGNYFYLGDPASSESLLRVAQVDDAGEIKRLTGGAALPGHQLSYDARYGYQCD
ncbi:CRISPR-associated helicase Cas3' [Candidatus Venteria ishoeyi]|uniref:CRISPR-associated helicase Cas3' n=1 Tax=Candidatus Venteria ishoeyi TaxID=1899563 RepID=UPI0025A5FC45|nr:CRISPR-associated helicase Cas3' [Candidatus Venteria ishoeyi]MDM8548190.1 CRISPR-associated helicase Cas3' [Candidatus Venteria ishoeyi]